MRIVMQGVSLRNGSGVMTNESNDPHSITVELPAFDRTLTIVVEPRLGVITLDFVATSTGALAGLPASTVLALDLTATNGLEYLAGVGQVPAKDVVSTYSVKASDLNVASAFYQRFTGVDIRLVKAFRVRMERTGVAFDSGDVPFGRDLYYVPMEIGTYTYGGDYLTSSPNRDPDVGIDRYGQEGNVVLPTTRDGITGDVWDLTGQIFGYAGDLVLVLAPGQNFYY